MVIRIKPRAILKILVDSLMTLALLLLMGFQFWGDAAHEWIGMGMFILFFVHHILNWNWYKNLFRGRYSAVRICGAIIDVLLVMTMIALVYSSVVMSRYVFGFLEISGGMSLARRIHILASYWGFILMSIHLGLHWSMIIGIIRKCMKITKSSQVHSILLFIASLVPACYGVYVFIKRDFLTYMLLKSEFVFLDYNESKFLFYLDYLALMGLGIFVFHYLGAALRKRRNTKK